MKALVKTKFEPGNIPVLDIPVPEVGPRDVLIKLVGSGVCAGGEVGMWRAGRVTGRESRRELPTPFVVGAENFGVIAEVGRDVEGWQVGDRVTSETFLGCGECRWCRVGEPNQCPKFVVVGRGLDGGMAEYYKVPARYLYRIADNVTDNEGVFSEMTAVVCQALNVTGRVDPGDVVAIIGPGPIGQLAAQVARAMGASNVLVLGLSRDAKRLAIAQEISRADIAIDIEQEDPVEIVMDATHGIGVDTVVTCVTPGVFEDEVPQSFQAPSEAMQMVRIGGRIIHIGGPASYAGGKGVTITYTTAHAYEAFERAVRLMAARAINLDPLVTRWLPLEQWQESFTMVGETDDIKIVLRP